MDKNKKEVMHVYAASNFTLLRYIEKEKKFRAHIIEHYGECGRLYSQFFTKEIQNVLKLMQEEYKERQCQKNA